MMSESSVHSATSLAAIFQRLVTVWRKRGVRKFLLFMAGRLLRLQRDVVYHWKPESKRAGLARISRGITAAAAQCGALSGLAARPCEKPGLADFPDLTLCRVGADRPPDSLEPEVHQQLFALEDAQYRAQLYKDDLLFAVLDHEGRVIHHSYAFYRSSYKHLLGLDPKVPLIGNCETIEAWRGRGIFPSVLVAITHYLTEARDHDSIYTSCAPDNTPSMRAMEKAGFSPCRRISSIIFLNRYVVQSVTEITAKRKWRVFDMKNPG